MGVCLLPEQFEELNFSYDYKKEEEKEKEKLDKYMKNQRIIRANIFQIERLKYKNVKKKQTLEKKFDVVSNDSILLLSTTKKNFLAKSVPNYLIDSKLFISEMTKTKKYDIINYPKDVLELINKIRNDPKSFIKDVENAISKIETYKNKIIYNGNIRVYLNKGENMFLEAIKCLNDTNTMGNLTLNEEISIELPNENDFNNDKDFFKNQILTQRRAKKIERYYREAIKDPYTGVLMMIVDDTTKNQGEKRKTILDPNLNKVGIKCKLYGNKFLAYLTFGK